MTGCCYKLVVVTLNLAENLKQRLLFKIRAEHGLSVSHSAAWGIALKPSLLKVCFLSMELNRCSDSSRLTFSCLSTGSNRCSES
jgi:hypothetical protein